MMRLLRLWFVVLVCTLQSSAQSFYSRLFTTEQGLPDNYVYSVMQDHSGYVWVSSGKGLVKFDGQLFMPFNPDSLTEGEMMSFKGIPSFSPEHFRYINNADPLKAKQLEKGVDQLCR